MHRLVLLVAASAAVLVSPGDYYEPTVPGRLERLRWAIGNDPVLWIGEGIDDVLVELDDPADVSLFLGMLDIDEAASGGHYRCLGSLQFMFVRGDRLLTTVNLHHGYRLSWLHCDRFACRDYWDGHAVLTDWSAFLLTRWLARRGVAWPLEELRRCRRRNAHRVPW